MLIFPITFSPHFLWVNWIKFVWIVYFLYRRFFENSFFPATITKWNELDSSLHNDPSINVFKQNILKFVPLGPNNVFNIYNPHSPKLSTRLHLGLSHLRGHKFKHNFSDGLDEICVCFKDIESTNHFLLQCSWFLKESQLHMNKIRDIDSSFIDHHENPLCYTLFDKENMNDSKNAYILNATRIHWLDWRIVRKQLDIMSTYHYVQNQEKLMMQSRENGQKPQFGQFLDDFEVKYLQIANFFEK